MFSFISQKIVIITMTSALVHQNRNFQKNAFSFFLQRAAGRERIGGGDPESADGHQLAGIRLACTENDFRIHTTKFWPCNKI
jgi:hypothetical protein